MRFNFFTYKDCAKRLLDKMKSRRIFIFHAELQPIFAKGCTNSLHPSIIHHYILINFHHPPHRPYLKPHRSETDIPHKGSILRRKTGAVLHASKMTNLGKGAVLHVSKMTNLGKGVVLHASKMATLEK